MSKIKVQLKNKEEYLIDADKTFGIITREWIHPVTSAKMGGDGYGIYTRDEHIVAVIPSGIVDKLWWEDEV